MKSMDGDELGLRQSLSAFGIPTALIADDPDLLATARAAYSDWVADQPASNPEIEIRLETAGAPSTGVGFGIDVKGSRLRVAGPDFQGTADALARRAAATVPRRLVGKPDALAAEIVDTLLLFLLARSGRTPVHAAGVMVGGTAVALIGRSGSGKSSLALAAAQRGLPVLSDDTLYVQHEPRFRVWALRRPIHVFAEDAPPGAHETRERGGKRKAVVRAPGDAAWAAYADRAEAVLLERGEQLELKRLAAEEAKAALPPLEPGFDLLPEEAVTAAEALLNQGAWRLTLTRDPDGAIDLLLREFAPRRPEG